MAAVVHVSVIHVRVVHFDGVGRYSVACVRLGGGYRV